MGNLIQARESLGYFWEVEGKVVEGKSLGKKLGFPTANINYLYQISPSNGIYAGWVKVDGESVWREQLYLRGLDRIIMVLKTYSKFICFFFLETYI